MLLFSQMLPLSPTHNEGPTHPAKGTVKSQRRHGRRECPGTRPALYGKRCSLLNLGYCVTFLKKYLSSLQLWSSYQIAQVLVARLWEQHTNTFSLFLYLLNLQFSSSFPPCCAFNLNLTETMDEFCNRHCWFLSPRKAFWIG